uniref:Putative u3 small nucleolar rna-associated protein 6 n=2 Tax=Ixodes ricinus TaxID=34613 RepID=A0A131XVT8_IXORI
MAEFVQKNIENFIPELEQMQRIGLFTRDQIREILRRRKRFEYRLRRMKKSKEDFLKYIQYELNLYDLLQKRRTRLGITEKRNDIDLLIAKRVNRLFKKAVLMFKSDSKLWLSHIEFCTRMGWEHAVSSLYTRMLQLHSKRPEIWVAAAKWQLEQNNSPEMARKLLQRGLLFNENSQLLWHEYFRMELIYTDKMRKRRDVLGVEKEEAAATDAVLAAKIPSLVYKAATKAIPGVTFALSFLPLCSPFEFAAPLEDEIYREVQEQYSEKEETWDALARRHLSRRRRKEAAAKDDENADRPKKSIVEARSVFECAVSVLPTEKMWKLYIQFYLELLEKSHSQKNAEKRLLRVLDIMKRASDENQLTLEHHLEWVKLLQNCGEADAAATCAEAAVEKWDRSTEAWLLLLEMQVLQSLETDAVRATLERALKHIPKEESLPIWQLGLTWMSAACPTKTIEFLEGGLYFPPAVCIYIKEKLLELNCLYHGYKAARKFYKRMLLLKPLSLGFFQAMVNIENAHATPSAHRLRGYFEDATLEFGQSCTELWLKYITFELKHAEGKPECAGVLYQRAVKALKDELVDEFIARYSLLDPGQAEMDD